MNKFSIKMRVNIYYSAVLIITTLLVLVIFFSAFVVGKKSLSVDNVRAIVQDGFDKINYENGVVQIDNNFDTFVKGITLVVYSEDGNRIHGGAPKDFDGTLPLENDRVTKYQSGDIKWIVFDLFKPYPKNQGVWIRGLYLEDNGISSLDDSWILILLGLVVFFGLAIMAGKRITNRAFNPVNDIVRTSEEISNSRDFSKRISLPMAEDELYFLSKNINNMLGKLEESYIAEKEFSQDVAHELRTPISVVLAECEYSLEKDASKEEYVEALSSIKEQCERSMGLISKLLQLTKVLDKDAMIEKEIIDLSQLCKLTIEEMCFMENEKDIEVIGHIQEGINFYCDEGLIMRMLMNLINNSITYGNMNGKTHIYLEKTNEGEIVLEIKDNGIGIAEEYMDKIFNRFFRVSREGGKTNNSGLGLPMVKWIVDGHNGKITVDSEVGVGTSFKIKFARSF